MTNVAVVGVAVGFEGYSQTLHNRLAGSRDCTVRDFYCVLLVDTQHPPASLSIIFSYSTELGKLKLTFHISLKL